MTKNKISIVAIAVLSVLIFSCKPEIKQVEASSGSANLSNYVAVGNSITAGYADGTLYKSGQAYSFANIMAQQFKNAGGGDFYTPEMLDELGFPIDAATGSISPTGTVSGRRVMGYTSDYLCPDGTTVLPGGSLSPIPMTGTVNPANFSNIYDVNKKFNNLGVPGAGITHFAFPGYGAYNPYFGRMASSSTASIASEVAAKNPTFFSFWLGNNDILGYARSGGEQSGVQPTDVNTFSAAYSAAIDAMTANGAKGVVANIPDITSAPFFTTIPWNGFVITDTALLRRLNTDYSGLLPRVLGYTFKLGANPFIVQDSSIAPFFIRTMREDELVCLTLNANGIKCLSYGIPVLGGAVTLPGLRGKDFLSYNEIAKVNSFTNAYNDIIKAKAAAKGLAFVDIYSKFNTLKNGAIYDGVSVSSKFVTGGLFSLDGVHPTPRGQAIIANEFIKAINSKYAASIPTVNIVDYPGVKMP